MGGGGTRIESWAEGIGEKEEQPPERVFHASIPEPSACTIAFKQDEWMGKLILDSEVSYVLDPRLGRCLGLGQIVLGERFEDVVIKVADHTED